MGLAADGSFTFRGDNANRIEWDGSVLDVRGRLVAGDIQAGGTITGSTLRTAASGTRFVVSANDGEGHYYGDRGDGTIEELITLGIETDGSDSYLMMLGASGTSQGIHGILSNLDGTVLDARSQSGPTIVAVGEVDTAIRGTSGGTTSALEGNKLGSGGSAILASHRVDNDALHYTHLNSVGTAPSHTPSNTHSGSLDGADWVGDDGSRWWWDKTRWKMLDGLVFARLTDSAAHTVSAGDIESAGNLRYSNGGGSLNGGAPPGNSYMCLGHAHDSGERQATMWIRVS